VRVLFVTNLWPDSERPWHGVFVRNQAEGLRNAGVDVDVLPIRGYAGRLHYLRAARPALGLNLRNRYDVVHAHYGHSAVVARLQLRAPLVISYHGSDLMGKPTETGPPTRSSMVEVAVFRQLARVAAATITMSDRMTAVLPPSCLARNNVIPTGVDLERFAPGDKARARRELGWPEDESVAVWVGNPDRALKNHRLAHAAMEQVPEARLRVAWQVEPELIPLWLRASDLLLLTSRSEGSPTVVKEALASELPVVSTDVGDVAERIAGLPGCAITGEEATDVARAIRRALDHGPVPEGREAISVHSEQATARRLAELYERVVG
jgi:teichuronic acid biosynthesis glycosyltransferase TuaC